MRDKGEIMPMRDLAYKTSVCKKKDGSDFIGEITAAVTY